MLTTATRFYHRDEDPSLCDRRCAIRHGVHRVFVRLTCTFTSARCHDPGGARDNARSSRRRSGCFCRWHVALEQGDRYVHTTRPDLLCKDLGASFLKATTFIGIVWLIDFAIDQVRNRTTE